jgi:hypothetical protein
MAQIRLQKTSAGTLFGSYLPLSGGTVTGLAYFDAGLSATTLSGNGSQVSSVTADDATRFNTKLPQEYSLTSHTHSQLHNRRHAVDSIFDHDPIKLFLKDGL